MPAHGETPLNCGFDQATVVCHDQSGRATTARPKRNQPREATMAVASVTKVTASSPDSFEGAVEEGVKRASSSLRGITGIHVVDQKAKVVDGIVDEWRVTMEITFLLE